jgi:septal ring-binding cell division protein DamX
LFASFITSDTPQLRGKLIFRRNNMPDDLFEDEIEDKKEKKSSEEKIDVFADDDVIENSSVDEEANVFADDEASEATSDDDEAWIPLDDEELKISSDDEKTDAPSEGEEISDEELRELEKKYGVDDEDVEIEAEAPPWEEGVEIPVHAATGSPKRKKTFMIVSILFLVALVVAGVYVFLQSKQMLVKKEIKPKDEKPLFVNKKMETISSTEAGPEIRPEKKPAQELTAVKVNNAPTISGQPATSVREGALYSFIPKAVDIDPRNKLTFFIANQPVWTSFDINTGALSGTPRTNDVGTYENIVILVSDGAATASLPGFAITVTEVAPVVVEEKKAQQEKPNFETEFEKEEAPEEPPEEKKEILKEVEVGQYTPPDLADLIKQSEFQDAALEYYKEVKQFPNAYALKLEVVCAGKSVQTAFQQGNFDRRMFILPKEINGKGCFVVFWGLYTTKNEAIKALSSIPAFFGDQGTKPGLVLIKQYL